MKKALLSLCLSPVLSWCKHLFHSKSTVQNLEVMPQVPPSAYLFCPLLLFLPFPSYPSSLFHCVIFIFIRPKVGRCQPSSPERCRSAGCSDSLEDLPHYFPPCCHSERHSKEKERREVRWWWAGETPARDTNAKLDLVDVVHAGKYLFDIEHEQNICLHFLVDLVVFKKGK